MKYSPHVYVYVNRGTCVCVCVCVCPLTCSNRGCTARRQRAFAEQSSAIFAKCGVKSIVYTNMTWPLSHVGATEIFGRVAGDPQHYGRAVNLLKARHMLRSLLGCDA